MDFDMQKANMLAENLKLFIRFVDQNYESKNSLRANLDRLYQVKLLVEEYQLPLLAAELQRINMHTWDGAYTYLLVGRIKKGLSVIEEYVNHHKDDLFLFSARLYTLENLSGTFGEERNDPTQKKETVR